MNQIMRKIIEIGSDSEKKFGFKEGLGLQQIPDEIAAAIVTLMHFNIEHYLEIGAASGACALLMNHFFKFKTVVIVDDDKHPKHVYRPLVLRHVEHHEFLGNSNSPGVFSKVMSFCVKFNFYFDLIMIDGDHSYQGCRLDFDAYTDLLARGGFVLLHDTVICPGVHRLFEEIKDDDRWIFIAEYKSVTNPLGLGLFRKK